jgi:hypothetical protein
VILAIDPGDIQSAYAILDESLKPVEFGILENYELLKIVEKSKGNEMAIEMVASYGMPVGVTTFETVFWIGRFWEAFSGKKTKVYRKEVKMNLCHSMKAKDGNVRQALIDRFGVVGTKKNPGWFYGVSKDVWSAVAVGVTYCDLYLKNKGEDF